MFKILILTFLIACIIKVHCRSGTDIPPYQKCKPTGPGPVLSCQNGGTCYNVSGTATCHCQDGFTGLHCERLNPICTPENTSTEFTCPEKMQCRSALGNGYQCVTPNSRPNLDHEYCSQSPCPPTWTCIDSNKNSNGFSCQLISDAKIMFPVSRHNTNSSDICAAQKCMHASDCVDGACVCLLHYEGEFCEKTINYCARKPCSKEAVGCVPKFGTYECRCTEDRTGKGCSIFVHRPEQRIKNAGILYKEQQYQNTPSVFAFYVEYPGTFLNMFLNYGDDTELKFNDKKLIYYPNARERLKRLFAPPLNLPSNKLYIFFHQHAYNSSGVKNISIKASKLYDAMYSTTFAVNVKPKDSCKLMVKLTNAAKFPYEATIYRRSHTIRILSAARVDCVSPNLIYKWTLHRVENLQDELTKETIYQPKYFEISHEKPHLIIPPYILDFGNYVVVHRVEMTRPQAKLTAARRTWFTVRRKPMVPHLDGGSLITVQQGVPLTLDASKSYDPNYSLDAQPATEYIWSCEAKNLSEVDDFCYGSRILSIGPASKYTVNTTLLRPMERYTFKVRIIPADNMHEFSRTRMQKVDVLYTSPNLRLECIRNCIGGVVNPNYLIAFRGTFVASSNIRNDLYTLFITPMTKSMEIYHRQPIIQQQPEVLDLHIRANILQTNEQYRIILKEADKKWWNDRAEVFLFAYSDPYVEKCKILPLQGIAMLTNFTIKCYDVGDDETPLTFVVHQYMNGTDQQGILVTYDHAPLMSGIALSPGLPERDYLTALKVELISSVGMRTHVYVNATVLPLSYYINGTESQMLEFERIIYNDNSPLAMLIAGSNYIGSLQLITATAKALSCIIRTGEYSSSMQMTVEKLKEVLMTHVWMTPMTVPLGIKHITTALDAVLELPDYPKLSLATVMGSISLNTILTRLENKKQYGFYIDKKSMEDMLVLVMEIANKLLNRSLMYCGQTEKPIGTGPAKQAIDLLEIMNLNETDTEVLLQQYTKTVLSHISRIAKVYAGYLLLYEEPTVFRTPDMVLIALKTSTSVFKLAPIIVPNVVAMKFALTKHDYDCNVNIDVTVRKHNPYWWKPISLTGGLYPVIHLRVFDHWRNVSIPYEVDVTLEPVAPIHVNFLNGTLVIKPYWTLTDQDVQTFRLEVPKYGKPLIQFKPLPENVQLQVVVKEVMPVLQDFWNEAVLIPQKPGDELYHDGNMVFVDDDVLSNGQYFYVGVLPHQNTLQRLWREQEAVRIANKDIDGENVVEVADTVDFNAHYEQFTTFNSNSKLEFSLGAFGARCLVWEDVNSTWIPGCQVTPLTSSLTVACHCANATSVTVKYYDIEIESYKMGYHFLNIPFKHNPLIPVVIVCFVIMYLGLLFWLDRLDKWLHVKGAMEYLSDNKPTFPYTYVVKVTTGDIGTTSNVGIILEGSNATSEPHILKSRNRPVLTRASQDWFVVKTAAALGDITCIHLWHDNSGENPSWSCKKITIHDIKENHIWVFNVHQILGTLKGNGSMSCTVYKTIEPNIFANLCDFKDYLMNEINFGQHAWFSIFYRNPFSLYTRKQRLTVALADTAIIMLITALYCQQNLLPASNFQGTTLECVRIGLCVSFLGIPLHSMLVILFRCVKPNLPESDLRENRKTCLSVERSSITSPENSYENISLEQLWKYAPHLRLNVIKIILCAETKAVALQYPVSPVESDAKPEQPVNEESIKIDSPGEWKNAFLTKPILAYEKPIQQFNLPSWCGFIIWIMLLGIATQSFLSVVRISRSFDDQKTNLYLFVTISAILSSVLITETVKVLITAAYKTVAAATEFTLENRSKEAESLNKTFAVPKERIPMAVESINELHSLPMYRPLLRSKCNKLNRASAMRVEFTKLLIDIAAISIMIISLITIINEPQNVNSQQWRNFENMIQGVPNITNYTLDQINSNENMLQYLNRTLIPNIYNTDFMREDNSDFTNHILGVPRLRQIRMRPGACWFKSSNITTDQLICTPENAFDKRSYYPGWKYHKTTNKSSSNINNLSWKQQNPLISIESILDGYSKNTTQIPWKLTVCDEKRRGKLATYPPNGYVLLLGRNSQSSDILLEYIARENWFDELTRAVFIDFVMYNPNLNYATDIKIILERTIDGNFTSSFQIDLANSSDVNTKTKFCMLVCVILVVIMLIAQAQAAHLKDRIQKLNWFHKLMHINHILIIICGTLGLILHLKQEYEQKICQEFILHANFRKYYSFMNLIGWNRYFQYAVYVMVTLMNCKLAHIFYGSISREWYLEIVMSFKDYVYVFGVLVIFTIATVWNVVFFFGANSAYLWAVWYIIVKYFSLAPRPQPQDTTLADAIVDVDQQIWDRFLSITAVVGSLYFMRVTFPMIFKRKSRIMQEPTTQSDQKTKKVEKEYVEPVKINRKPIQAEKEPSDNYDIPKAKLMAMGHLLSDMYLRTFGTDQEIKIGDEVINRESTRDAAMAAVLLNAVTQKKEHEARELELQTKRTEDSTAYRIIKTASLLHDLDDKINKIASIVSNTFGGEE